MERVGNLQGSAYISGNLGLIHLQWGQLDEIEKLFRYNLEISQRLGDVHSIGLAFNALGQVFKQRGDNEQAVHYMARAYLIFARLGAAGEAQQAAAHMVEMLGSVDAAEAYSARVAGEE
jgi:tetratricopeptide (TPR) repeat protein